jgi:peptidoglycan/xylan/chitin deacetylase (PgdA/CDA1 family)
MLRASRHGPRTCAAVAFTFDDGPGEVTGDVLDVLAAHRARATFNVLGWRIAQRECLLRRAVAEGHEIGVHGWAHDDHRRHVLAGARGVARTARAVAAACGAHPRVFRPPFGLTNVRVQLSVALAGFRTVLWDVDPRDFEEPGGAAIRDRTLAALRSGSIVLLHDDRRELAGTAEALDGILSELASQGLRATTVSELLG